MAVNDKEIFSKVRKILAKFLKIDENEIREDSKVRDDLGVDSVDFWEIIARMEKEFKIEVSEESPPIVNTVRDILRVVKEQIEISQK